MKVKAIKRLENTKLITFDDDSTLEVSTSARVGKDDEISRHDGGYFVVCVDNSESQIYPAYHAKTTMPVGGLMLPVEIKEPMTAQEFKDVNWLASFHYLGEECLKLSTLIVTTSMPNLPHTLGFAMMATAFNACAPRTPILHALLRKDEMPLGRFMPAWFAVRIVRVVVHPEFRGTGVAKLLVERSIEYATNRFVIGKRKPWIVEIVAMMLKYAPFVNRYMSYVGDTASAKASGMASNAKTVITRTTRDVKVGAVSNYQKYLNDAREIASKLRVDLDTVFDMARNPEGLDVETRIDIHALLHSPKPYYAVGLNDKAKGAIDALAKQAPTGYRPKLQKISAPILFKDIEVTFEESAKATERTHAVQAAFGVSPRGFRTTVLKDFTLEIKPGEIVLLTGISGSGKSIVLRVFQRRLELTRGEIIFPSDTRLVTLEEIKSDEPLIDLVGATIEEAFYTLNRVGLGEAKLYMKSYRSLSTGQKYRASIAKLIDGDANVWIADEFGSTLDVITANVVANSVQKHCRQVGITFIAACANPEHYIESLKPDYIIDLSAGRTTITRMENGNER